MNARLLLVLAIILCPTLWASGQVQEVKKEEVPRPVAPGVKKALPEEVLKDEKPGPKESQRMTKLKQLTYDRRPSAILKAWSKTVDPKDIPKEKLDAEIADLQRQVTLGQWPFVRKYLSDLPEDEAKAAYKQMLQSLAGQPRPDGPMPMGPGGGPMMQYMEKHQFSTQDVLGLAAAAPKGLDKETLERLGGVLRSALAGGVVVEHVVAALKNEVAKPKDTVTQRQAAQLLIGADQAAEAGVFLPSVEVAVKEKDHEALNLLTRHFLAMYNKDRKATWLEQGWLATQAVLAAGAAPRAELEDALKRAVELAPKVKEELGKTWLDASFTSEVQRGMDILATIGSLGAQGIMLQARNPDGRVKAFQLQKTAVEALIRIAPPRAKEWRDTLTLLAANWLKEAEFSYRMDTSTSLGPRIRRDPYGNFFYMYDDEPMPQMMMGREPNQPLPIVTRDLLQARPTDDWLGLIDEGVQPKIRMLFAQLFLKVGEENKAFPYIEGLANTHPEKTRELVAEFLRVWTRNHDPNAARGMRNPYMFMYGFERRAEGVPLTRSKQERNLVELAGWVERLRALNVGEVNEEALAKAFTTCHSSAEVFRLEAIEKVFGPLKNIKPRTLAGLLQQTRENLSGLWRDPAVQKDKGTNRKTKDIQGEVLRGYSLARTVVDQSLKQMPDEWSLHLAKAALQHDENNYHQELSRSSDFSAKRNDALNLFHEAARKYSARIKDLAEDEETTQVFEQWFYAGLGASDIRHVTEERLPDMRQPPLIRRAILALPGETAERHMGKFANSLFTRLSAVNPAIKFRYLKAGFDIVGDHPLAHEARKVFDYYKDLITEIKLETRIDGSDAVGHQKPFGVFVNIRHTREIERESGGFGRYLQNQNSGMYYAYNYGRPTADYRDKFQAAATEAFKEHFEVLSVTFQADKVNSRALPEYGWRYTPYAYLLLKAKGPQVDKLPPVRLDLDFLDTSGYVVIPVESPGLPLDCSVAKANPRPSRKLQIVQTLDERQADKGKLILEIKATSQGLVNEFDQILEFHPLGFDLAKTDDQGVSVAKFDPDSENNVIVSERTWMLTLQAKPGQAAPKQFQFATAKVEPVEMTYQRFQDADLVSVTNEISLEQQYGKNSYAWVWLAGIAGVIVVGAGLLLLILRRRVVHVQENRWRLPERLTPFTVLGLLRGIETNNGLSDAHREELRVSITTLERDYFAADAHVGGDDGLRALAETWMARAR